MVDIRSLFTPLRPHDLDGVPKHFFGIDLLRGLAAVATLIWHYMHFYMATPLKAGAPVPSVDHSIEPMYWLLNPIYHHGFWAVQAFWIISGFVFAHVYAQRSTSLRRFAVARIARLYPLHIITLVAVAALQALSWFWLGGFQIVTINDPYHFLLQTMFVSHWGAQWGISFNAPIWSVSVEIAIYLLFFVVARQIFRFGMLIPLYIASAGAVIMNTGTPVWLFAICTFFFFLGVTTYYLVIRYRQRPTVMIGAAVVGMAIFSWLVATGRATRYPFHNVEAFLFVPVLVLVAMLDLRSRTQTLIARARWFGDATYSMYLWHFPIQVAVLILVETFSISTTLFSSPVVLLAWIAGMIGLAHVSFIRIELPCKSWINKMATAAGCPDLDAPVRIADIIDHPKIDVTVQRRATIR